MQTTCGALVRIQSGLRHPVCKKIVERHNGEIRVESKKGKGSTFIFTIPKLENDIHRLE